MLGFPFVSEWIVWYGILSFWIQVVVHLAFAGGVWTDASRLNQESRGPRMVPIWVWVAATLLTGPIGAAAYWLVNQLKTETPG